ncbi:MAG TPA: alpha/beta hydrolase [Anaeromyxobacteraceae bacterium]|nr:alpha/beta hydrolase [Anaeromyxobacteraceae bacterium]
MPRTLLTLAVAATLALPLAGCRREHPRARRAAVQLEECQLAHATMPGRISARCGTVEVPEDWERQDGPRIRIAFAVLRAQSTTPASDAVFFLAGGPGQSARAEFVGIAAAFVRVVEHRDIVVVDQRGTGRSAPLECPADALDALAAAPQDDLSRARACAAALGPRVAAYGTDAFARDLDAVRAALGYEQVDLVGASYGTRAAFVYARRFPERVRALVLDGVAPPQMPIGGFFARDAERAYALLAKRCAADVACRTRFPDPRGDLGALLAQLERAAPRVRIPDPIGGGPRELTVRPDLLRGTVFLLSYLPETAALLPSLVLRARDGDVGPLAAQALLAGGDVAAGVSRPLNFSVLCSEDVPFFPPPGDASEDGSYLGGQMRESYERACGVWPRRPVDAAWKAPFRGDVPALLLSGEADPATPPSWGELALRGLPRGRHVVLRGHGHGSLVRGCVPQLVARFIETADAGSLDVSCVDRIAPAPPFLDLTGPSP